jgi:RNA polymerase sigma factor (sigma-70 family)
LNNEQLVAEYAATRSPASLDQVVRDNQRLLHHVLKRFATADEPYEDLLQVANLGLVKAVQRFDSTKGVRFSTYAVPVIEGEVRHHLRDSLLLRQPRWVKRVYRQIEEAVANLTRKLGRPPHLSEIAAELNISEAGILEVLNVYARIDLRGLSDSYADDGDPTADPGEVRALHLTSFSLPIEDRIALYDALDVLTAFQRKLIYLLFFREFTQHEVAAALGLTQKKVSRESIKALSKLKQVLTKKVL